MDVTRTGIILAGGTGTRLFPVTLAASKQLVPIYNKPMVYYPLGVLMLAGIRKIVVITTPREQGAFRHLLKDGSQWGISLKYEVQRKPNGIAEAFLIAEPHIKGNPSALVLGDNIFHGSGLSAILRSAAGTKRGATIFAHRVRHPQQFGVVEFDRDGRATSLEEKPTQPRSNFAVPGLYFYDQHVLKYVKGLAPSSRGELEITDLNKMYMRDGLLKVLTLGRGFAWLDTGTHHSMLQAAGFVEAVENVQGQMICCPEEIAYGKRWISRKDVEQAADKMRNSEYGAYLKRIVEEWRETDRLRR